MKKLSALIVMILCVIIGGVYATWTYTQNTDVADETVNMTLNLGDVAYSGSYGTYKVDTTHLTMTIEPKDGTTHTTALYINGYITITFTPNSVAPQQVKDSGVESTFQFTLSNNSWTYDDGEGLGERSIVTLEHAQAEEIEDWGDPDENGVFTYKITDTMLKNHIHLGEFLLDTKADYDAFNRALAQGQILITVSDGVTVSAQS